MRMLTEVLKPFEPQREPVMVDGLLHRGRITVYGVKVSSDQMTCQDCGSTEGFTCRDGEHKVWFCVNQKCIDTDSEITKKRDRKARKESF